MKKQFNFPKVVWDKLSDKTKKEITKKVEEVDLYEIRSPDDYITYFRIKMPGLEMKPLDPLKINLVDTHDLFIDHRELEIRDLRKKLEE